MVDKKTERERFLERELERTRDQVDKLKNRLNADRSPKAIIDAAAFGRIHRRGYDARPKDRR
jgi:hypothetical protein